jgi:hypothetical protein
MLARNHLVMQVQRSSHTVTSAIWLIAALAAAAALIYATVTLGVAPIEFGELG